MARDTDHPPQHPPLGRGKLILHLLGEGPCAARVKHARCDGAFQKLYAVFEGNRLVAKHFLRLEESGPSRCNAIAELSGMISTHGELTAEVLLRVSWAGDFDAVAAAGDGSGAADFAARQNNRLSSR